MKTSLSRAATTALSKRGKPKAKAQARASMENLFGMEEEEMARLFEEEMSKSKESLSSTSSSTSNDPTSLEDKVKATPKRRFTKTKSKGSTGTSSDKIISTNGKEDNLNQTRDNTPKANQGLVTKAASQEENSLDRNSLRTLESPALESEVDNFEYTFELTNEEVDGVSKQMSYELSNDLSFETDDEFFVELSDLEFGEDYPLDETPDNDTEITDKAFEQKDRVSNNDIPSATPYAEDESFELPENNISKPIQQTESETTVCSFGTNALATQESSVHEEDDSNQETIQDEKFDIDELINAGTNSYTPATKERRNVLEYQVSTPTIVKDMDCCEDVDDGSLPFESDPVLPTATSYQPTHYVHSHNESNLLPFGKYDMLQQILHAWAFGDTLELIHLGQESSLNDDPFYNGDDDDFFSHPSSNNTKQITKAEVIEHPLARYGLKVRTINAIELVGKENYYSLSEESRRELELMVQDLSKTEEGTNRNIQLKQAIFGMFN